MKKFFKTKNTKRAFTLVETLVAISILMIAITGPLVISSQILNYSYFARDQITAFYLAQDAVEYIRNIRDENNLKKLDWLTSLDACMGTNCQFDSTLSSGASNIISCTLDQGACSSFNYNSTTGLYGYERGSPSRFTREVKIEKIQGQDDEIALTVVVRWNTGNLEKSFTVNENLFNWQ